MLDSVDTDAINGVQRCQVLDPRIVSLMVELLVAMIQTVGKITHVDDVVRLRVNVYQGNGAVCEKKRISHQPIKFYSCCSIPPSEPAHTVSYYRTTTCIEPLTLLNLSLVVKVLNKAERVIIRLTRPSAQHIFNTPTKTHLGIKRRVTAIRQTRGRGRRSEMVHDDIDH
jgi:hypothetical protein